MFEKGSHRGVRFATNTHLPREAYGDSASAFHVTIRAHPKVVALPPSLRDDVWQALVAHSDGPRVIIHGACLMPNHVHSLVQPAAANLLDFVRNWKSYTTRLAWRHGGRGALWQPGMWDRTVRLGEDVRTVAAYIVENPTRAGLIEPGENWPWSMLRE